MSPRTDRQERRIEIIEATMRCLLRKGYSNISMADIVEESGLSTGTIYWHFKDKKDLFMSVFDYVLQMVYSSFGQLFEQEQPAGQKLHIVLSSISQMSKENIRSITLPLKFMIDLLHDEDILTNYQHFTKGVTEQFQAILEQGIADGEFREVDVFETAWMLASCIEGVLLFNIFGMPGNTQKQCQILADLVIKGLKN